MTYVNLPGNLQTNVKRKLTWIQYCYYIRKQLFLLLFLFVTSNIYYYYIIAIFTTFKILLIQLNVRFRNKVNILHMVINLHYLSKIHANSLKESCIFYAVCNWEREREKERESWKTARSPNKSGNLRQYLKELIATEMFTLINKRVNKKINQRLVCNRKSKNEGNSRRQED